MWRAGGPDLKPQPVGTAGVHHMAFIYASLADLVATYERLDGLGIRPVTCINHGPTLPGAFILAKTKPVSSCGPTAVYVGWIRSTCADSRERWP